MCNELSCYQSDPSVLKVDPKPAVCFEKRRITSTRLRARRCRIGSSRTGMKPTTHLRTKLGDTMTKMIRR